MVELGHAAKAMVLVEPRQLAATKIPSQPVEAGGWLAVEATAISGADVQAWHGERSEVQYPLIPGHQVVGRVAVADETIPYEIGTRVVLEPGIRCGKCSRCRHGLATCQFRKPSNTYGLIPSTEPPALWGGMAEYLYIDPAATIHPVTDDVPAEVATSVHSLATGHTWAAEVPDLRPGDKVLILGPGPPGRACVPGGQGRGSLLGGCHRSLPRCGPTRSRLPTRRRPHSRRGTASRPGRRHRRRDGLPPGRRDRRHLRRPGGGVRRSRHRAQRRPRDS